MREDDWNVTDMTVRTEELPLIGVSSDVPTVVIEPRSAWTAIDIGELWQARELLYFLTWRDVKVRYKQTALGAAWAVIQPLFTMLIFTLFFGRLAKMPSDGIPYPLFAYAGLLPWTFFANSISLSGNSLIGSTNLITKVYFPRMIIPGAAVLAGLVDFAIAFSILGVMMVWYRVPIGWTILMLPILVVITSVLALGIGMWLAAMHVKYHDIRYTIPFVLQLWMFATPIIYPASLMPQRYRIFLSLNPMTGVIEGYRVALLGGVNGAHFDWLALGISTAIGVAFLLFAAFDFRRMERMFADLV